jgi:hypothetical protein
MSETEAVFSSPRNRAPDQQVRRRVVADRDHALRKVSVGDRRRNTPRLKHPWIFHKVLGPYENLVRPGSIHQPARARPSRVAPRVEAGGVPGHDDPEPASASLHHREALPGDQLGHERRVLFRPLQHRDGVRGDQVPLHRPPRLRRVEPVGGVLGAMIDPPVAGCLHQPAPIIAR